MSSPEPILLEDETVISTLRLEFLSDFQKFGCFGISDFCWIFRAQKEQNRLIMGVG